jgi:hypothetical protein
VRAAVLCMLACGAPPPIGVELGTGTTSFVEIPEDDAELELVRGSQGGFHVDVTARIYDAEPEGLTITYAASLDGTIVSYPTSVELDRSRVVAEDDHYLRAGDFLQLEIAGPPEVVGRELEISVHVGATSGASAEDSRRATIVDLR